MREELTDRERAVLEGMAEGMTQQEIADDLSLSRHTIHCYAERIRTKLGARNTVSAVSIAYHTGILVPRVTT